MQSDENDVFDESVDPYDLSIDCEYDDGICKGDSDDDSDDNEDWDDDWDDESTVSLTAQSDEMADYDELED